jgi:hypothetical protein
MFRVFSIPIILLLLLQLELLSRSHAAQSLAFQPISEVELESEANPIGRGSHSLLHAITVNGKKYAPCTFTLA